MFLILNILAIFAVGFSRHIDRRMRYESGLFTCQCNVKDTKHWKAECSNKGSVHYEGTPCACDNFCLNVEGQFCSKDYYNSMCAPGYSCVYSRAENHLNGTCFALYSVENNQVKCSDELIMRNEQQCRDAASALKVKFITSGNNIGLGNGCWQLSNDHVTFVENSVFDNENSAQVRLPICRRKIRIGFYHFSYRQIHAGKGLVDRSAERDNNNVVEEDTNEIHKHIENEISNNNNGNQNGYVTTQTTTFEPSTSTTVEATTAELTTSATTRTDSSTTMAATTEIEYSFSGSGSGSGGYDDDTE